MSSDFLEKRVLEMAQRQPSQEITAGKEVKLARNPGNPG